MLQGLDSLFSSPGPQWGGMMQGPQFDPAKVNPMALQYAQLLMPGVDQEQAVSALYGYRPNMMGQPMNERQMIDSGIIPMMVGRQGGQM